MSHSPIGIFDSGYGGLTVFRSIAEKLPQYDYIYLGDNARAPYGTRSFETVYQYTLECVQWLFEQGCPLVILACNTASAKALRNIQQVDLPRQFPDKRVLGVIRPTAEVIGHYTKSKSVGILATPGTVKSESYRLEIEKFFPDITVFQQACPLWVPLIENNAFDTPAASLIIEQDIEKLLNQSKNIDTILLACTHYPVLMSQIKRMLPHPLQIISQGTIVAESLADYLKRHPEMETRLSQNASQSFYTTDDALDFETHAPLFFGSSVHAKHVRIG